MKNLLALFMTLFLLKCEALEPYYHRGIATTCIWEDSIQETYPTYANALYSKNQYLNVQSHKYRNCRIYKTEELKEPIKEGIK